MPTEVVHTLIPAGGGDYSTIGAWESAQQRDLVTADQIAVLECHAGSVAGAWSLAGWTTDATRHTIIRAAAGHEHGGIPGAGFKTTSGGASSTGLFNNHTGRLIGIEITQTGSANGIACSTGGTGKQIWIEGCIIGPVAATGINITGVVDLFVVNNIIRSPTTNGITYNTTGTCHAYNNTIIGGASGIVRSNGTVRPKNNIVHGATTSCFSGTMTASATNISSDATSPETGLRNITLDFVDSAGGNYHLAATDTEAIGAGTDLSADANLPFSTDIDGDSRPSGAWDIGADERVVQTGDLTAVASGTATFTAKASKAATVPAPGNAAVTALAVAGAKAPLAVPATATVSLTRRVALQGLATLPASAATSYVRLVRLQALATMPAQAALAALGAARKSALFSLPVAAALAADARAAKAAALSAASSAAADVQAIRAAFMLMSGAASAGVVLAIRQSLLAASSYPGLATLSVAVETAGTQEAEVIATVIGSDALAGLGSTTDSLEAACAAALLASRQVGQLALALAPIEAAALAAGAHGVPVLSMAASAATVAASARKSAVADQTAAALAAALQTASRTLPGQHVAAAVGTLLLASSAARQRALVAGIGAANATVASAGARDALTNPIQAAALIAPLLHDVAAIVTAASAAIVADRQVGERDLLVLGLTAAFGAARMVALPANVSVEAQAAALQILLHRVLHAALPLPAGAADTASSHGMAGASLVEASLAREIIATFAARHAQMDPAAMMAALTVEGAASWHGVPVRGGGESFTRRYLNSRFTGSTARDPPRPVF